MPGIALATDRREQLVDVTESVAAAVVELGVTDGAVLLHVPHTTAAVTINEGFDPDVAADVVDVLARLVPRDDGYAHLEGNSDSHAKSIMVGCSQLVAVAGGDAGAGALAAHLLLRVRRPAATAAAGVPRLSGGRRPPFRGMRYRP